MRLNYIISIFLITFIISCKEEKLESPLDKVFLCAVDEMLHEINFQDEWLTIGTNYFSWVPDGYMKYDSVDMGKTKISLSELENLDINVNALINVLNTKFPNGYKLVQISKEENEEKLRFEKNEKFCSWYFGALKRINNRYFLKGGYARSSRAGSGGHFIIEIDTNGICNVIANELAIF